MALQNEPLILAIETATDTCSVALSAGSHLLSLKEQVGTLNHASIITVMIDELFKETKLEMRELAGVILSEGPGSYTSLRVGMSTAKGLCFGLDIPLFAVNTLESLALRQLEQDSSADFVCAMIDARRMEVYASVFDRNGRPSVENQALILEEDVFDSLLGQGQGVICCGNGSVKAKPLFKGKNIRFSDLQTSAVNLINPGLKKFHNGNSVDLAYFSPNYIKSPNITKAKRKLL